MKNESYYIASVGVRTHDLPHTVASNMVKVSNAPNHSATAAVKFNLWFTDGRVALFQRCLTDWQDNVGGTNYKKANIPITSLLLSIPSVRMTEVTIINCIQLKHLSTPPITFLCLPKEKFANYCKTITKL